MSMEASYKATSDHYLAALKAVYEVRHNPDAVGKVVMEAIAPCDPITQDDLAWAAGAIKQIERNARK